MNRELLALHRPAARAAGLLGALLSAGLHSGCGDAGDRAPAGGAPVKPAQPPRRTSWSTEEMAADPEGYLLWADGELAAQVATRQERVTSVDARRNELAQRRQGFGTNLADLENIEKRLATAMRKSDEEDRLPIRMGGRTFERDKAKAILAEMRRLIDERGPLRRTYDDGIARLDQITGGLKADIARLSTLRDKLAIDLEQVRVSHGVAELEKLRTTEAEIAHYSKILGSMAEEGSGALPNAPAPVDLDKLLE